MRKPRKTGGSVKKGTTRESTKTTHHGEASPHNGEKASKQKPREVTDDELEAVMIKLVNERGSSKTCCPSEVPRRVLGEKGPWRVLMARIRAIAIRLSKAGALVITQKGQVIDVKDQSEIRGPIRLRLP